MLTFKKFLVYYFYRFLMLTWRIKVDYHPDALALVNQKNPLLLGHWHGHEVALIHLVKTLKLATLASKSKDGRTIAFLIERLGGQTTKGSSSKSGASGLLGLIRLLKSGKITSIAVDGPRGPVYEVKPGIFELARICKAPIIPVAASASPIIRFEKAWNKAFLPIPFAKIHIVFAEPVYTFKQDLDPRGDELKQNLALRLNAASRDAGKSIAGA